MLLTTSNGFAAGLERWDELKSLRGDPEAAAFFAQSDEFAANELGRECMARWMHALAPLDPEDWFFLKGELVPHIGKRKPQRGYQQFFDHLGQALAYDYLKSMGCSGVHFILVAAGRTPDLEGYLNGQHILCEVKTINISDEEAAARHQPGLVRDVSCELSLGFFEKFQSCLTDASNQLRAYDPSRLARHIVFLNIRFDDWLELCREEYCQQIAQYCADHPQAVEIVVGPRGF